MRRNLIECKAVERLGTERRQQLWNYMRQEDGWWKMNAKKRRNLFVRYASTSTYPNYSDGAENRKGQ